VETALSVRQQELLACLVERLGDATETTFDYWSEWLGVLPFGQYHALRGPDGIALAGLPDGWERDDVLALERLGLVVRLGETRDADAPDDVRIVFRFDRVRVVEWVTACLGADPQPQAVGVVQPLPPLDPHDENVRIGPLDARLPAPYRLRHRERSDQAMPGPPGAAAIEEKGIWDTGDGREFWLFHWSPMAPRPGGPMAVAREWPAVVAGQRTTIIETSVFMGQSRRAMVAHLRWSEPAAQGLLIGEGMDHEEFARLAAGLVDRGR